MTKLPDCNSDKLWLQLSFASKFHIKSLNRVTFNLKL